MDELEETNDDEGKEDIMSFFQAIQLAKTAHDEKIIDLNAIMQKKKDESENREEKRVLWQKERDLYLMHLNFPVKDIINKLTTQEPLFQPQVINNPRGMVEVKFPYLSPSSKLLRNGVSMLMYNPVDPYCIAFRFGECFTPKKVKEAILSTIEVEEDPVVIEGSIEKGLISIDSDMTEYDDYCGAD